MSYISNGCNDCSSVEFGNNGLLNNGNQMNFLNSNQSMFDNSSANQFVFQQPQQSQQIQMPQMQQQQQVQAPMVVQSTLTQAPMNQQPQVQAQTQPKMQKPAQMQMQPVAATADKNQGLQAIIGNYLMDNIFTLIVAFLVASAWHTTIKYYIDQAIKFSGGTPTYYIVYAVLATLVSIFLSSMK
jgi:hypothetical protein